MWRATAGGQSFVFSLPALPGAQGAPIQVVVNTTEPFQNLNEVVQAMLKKAQDSGKFWFIDADLKIDKPQSTVVVDRDLISTLGLTQQDVGSALADGLGGGYVNYFSIAGRSYKVIPQVLQADRRNPDQVLDYYVRRPDGGGRLAGIGRSEPQARNRTAVDQPLPAVELCDDHGRERHVAGRGPEIPARCADRSRADRLSARLLRPVTPVRAGVGRLRDHPDVRGDHRISGT